MISFLQAYSALMNRLILCLLFIGTCCQGQTNKRIALTSNSTVPSSSIAQGLEDKCVGVTLTLNAQQADYLLEAAESHHNGTQPRWELTLFGPTGDVLYHTKTRSVDNAVKDVCVFLGVAKAR